MMTNPGAGLAPIRSGLREQVNARYAGADEGIREKLLAGGSKTGKYGRAVRQAEYSRLGELGGVDGQIARLVLEQQDRGTSLAERLLGMNFGQEASGSTSSSSTMSGTSVAPGSAAAGGLAGGLTMLTTLMALQQQLMGEEG